MRTKLFAPGELHDGDFLLFSGSSFIDRGIEVFAGKYSHATQFVGNGYLIEATEAGVEKNTLAPLVKQADSIAVLRVPNLSVDDAERLKNGAYAQLTVGLRYDFINLFSLAPYFALRKIGINVPWLVLSATGRVICSEMCALNLLAINIKLAEDPKLVAPQTMRDAVNKGIFQLVYED